MTRPDSRGSSLLDRIMSWRFLALLLLAVVDGLVFVVPIGSLIVVIAAVMAPEWLRGIARFLTALADGE